MNRIVGLETEYGCLVGDPSEVPETIRRVRDWVFDGHRHGLIDLHQRDWDEPAGNGGFLLNGGRVYLDMGHLEYCTPECRSLLDVLRYDCAGDRMILDALKKLRLDHTTSFIRNNVDHYSGTTFGCHENYLVRRNAPLSETNVQSLLTFLTLRMLYTSAGRVGTTMAAEFRGDATRPGRDDTFQISQRADYINNDLFEWVQFNRAIINTRDEPLADPRRYRRLHLLHGDTSVLPATLLLKVGTTALVLDLLETDQMPAMILDDAVGAFRRLSHLPDGPWTVALADGRTIGAVDVLKEFWSAAGRQFFGRDEETDHLLKIWGDALESLESNRGALVGRIDWITKKWLLEQFMAREGLDWSDAWLKSQDLEFHQVDPAKSLGLALAETPEPWKIADAEIRTALESPPKDTRAAIRSHAMRQLIGKGLPYHLDWEILGVEGGNALPLPDPFETNASRVDEWLAECHEQSGSGPRKPRQGPIRFPG